MRTLVIGGTGTVGSQVSSRLAALGVDTAILSRTPGGVQNLPAGVRQVHGDLERPDSVRRALTGIERLMLITPLIPNEGEVGVAAVEAAREAGVARIVYLSIHDVWKAPHLPHFASKLAVEGALERSGIPHTLLMTNNFFQNDGWWRESILRGVYPQPLGSTGVSRVDVRDIADVAVLALTEDGHLGKKLPLSGAEAMTGESSAREFARALGRPVRYAGDDVEVWGKLMESALPPWLLADFKEMYLYFQRSGMRTAPGDVETLTRLLGRPPRTFAAFCAEVAAEVGATVAG